MKKNLIVAAIAAVASMMVAGPAMADIVNSRHNLGNTGDYQYNSSNETEICVFCHTPHNPQTALPLWNRSTQSLTTYQLYTANNTLTSATKAAVVDVTHFSYKCLSCHDGSMGLGDGVFNTAQVASITMNAGSNGLGGYAELGTNLVNSHPIGMKYDRVQATDLNGSSGGSQFPESVNNAVGSGLLPLFGGASNYVECPSCHNPHGVDGAEKFLRRTNASSKLCLTCHEK
jgi:predicted CXXCH cytochrome family protein